MMPSRNTLGMLLALACLGAPAGVRAQNPSSPAAMPGLRVDPLPTPNSGEWSRPASTHRQALFPQATKDGRYWFQFIAPNAQVVQLDIEGKSYQYKKDATGVWNVFVPYQGPGVKYVTVYVDGVPQPEPGTHMYYSNGWKSAIESPAPDEDYYAIKDVPHGDVREHWMKSQVTGTWRRMFVYTPPGYDQSPGTRYPVLYLQHGAGEMEQEWTHSGLANYILDNLIAEGKAVPMIIVMNNGFATRPGEPPAGLRPPVNLATPAGQPLGYQPPPRPDPNAVSAFEEMLVKEVIPDIDRNFRTIPDRQHRAMAGLSMGGGQTWTIGLRHLDTFSHLGMFSGAVFGELKELPEPLKDAATFNRLVPVFFFSSGDTGNDTQIHAWLTHIVDMSKAAGVNAIFFNSPGTKHEWQTWRRSLHEYAPLLFRK
jgi:enterochelin esterase-like enzyme